MDYFKYGNLLEYMYYNRYMQYYINIYYYKFQYI